MSIPCDYHTAQSVSEPGCPACFPPDRAVPSVHAYIANYTPHTINFDGPHGGRIFASEGIARASEVVEPGAEIHWCVFGDCGMHEHITPVRKRFGAVTGLPDPREHVLYIVSQIVFDALPKRRDLLVPHDMVRDAQGRVTGCRGFAGRM